MMKEMASVFPAHRGGVALPPPSVKKESSVSFAEVLKGFLRDVNKSQLNADRSIERLATGQIADVHEVMLAVEEANVSLSLLVEIRNKVLEAYQQLTKMPV